jgi:hypothetical protein
VQTPRAASPPDGLAAAAARINLPLTPHLLVVRLDTQQAELFGPAPSGHQLLRAMPCSTSRVGAGQVKDSNCTPLGLHRVAEKIGANQPVGMVFKARQPVGMEIRGNPATAITTRILWLEGLEPGFNRGGDVDTHARYIYIHGTGDERSIGQPVSAGCIHLAAADLLAFFDIAESGTLVWITAD